MSHPPHITNERLAFPGGEGAEVRGELLKPESAPPLPGVVLLHDRYGLTDHVRDTARRLAAQDYAVLAVDLFSRDEDVQQFPPTREQSRNMSRFPDERTTRDVQGALAHMRTRKDVDPGRIALVGFSFGARYGLLTAGIGEDVAALVVFYPVIVYPQLHESRPRQPLSLIPSIKCPVMTIYGEKDWMAPLSQVTFMESLLHGHGKVHECVRYPDQGHGFFNSTIKQYNEAIAKDSFDKMLVFLSQHVKGKR